MKQLVCLRSFNAPFSSRLSNIWHTSSFGATEANEQTIWPCAGTFANLIVNLDGAPGTGGSGKGWTFTLRKNGVDTALTVTIMETATTARDITNSVTVAAGDLMSLIGVPISSPASPGSQGMLTNLEFSSTNTGESGYGMSTSNLSASATVWNGVFAQWTWATTSGVEKQNVVAAAGVIDKLYVRLTGSPGGVGKTYTFNLYKNSVKQDGTGGTVDTTVAITNAATSGNATFSLSLSPGDTIYLECVPTGTPTLRAAGASVKFTATTDGQSQMCGWHSANLNTVNTAYTLPQSYGGAGNWSTSEVTVKGAVTSFTLSGLRVVLTGDPGAGKTYTISMRRNAASPGGTPSAQIADTATTGSDGSGSVAIVDGDTWGIRSVPSGTPTARAVTWGLIQTMTPTSSLPTFSRLLVSP
jgi:hypothetical protein